MLRLVVVAGLALVTGACMPKNGRLEINRFQHEEYPYAVFYAPDGSPLSPLGGSWQVDNFAVKPGHSGYAPKQGPEYTSERRYDTDDNGKPDAVEREPLYDLLLEHTQKDASMWVRTVPVAAKDKDKELAVFAERYVESVAGSGAVLVRFGADGPVGAVEKRFASRLLHSETCTVSKHEAYRVDFEVANVDQLQLSDQARWERGSVVFVRTGYGHRVRQPPSVGAGYADYPVLMVIGIAAKPQDFSSLEGDFERLLKQTVLGEIGKGLSMNGETTCASSNADTVSGGEVAPTAPELNEAAQVPLAPEALPQPDGTPAPVP